MIEDEVFLGPRVITMNDKNMTYHRNNLKFVRRAPYISKGARIGGGSVLLPNIIIGENAVVGSGSVVTKDIPSRVMAFGNPAKVIKKVNDDEII